MASPPVKQGSADTNLLLSSSTDLAEYQKLLKTNYFHSRSLKQATPGLALVRNIHSVAFRGRLVDCLIDLYAAVVSIDSITHQANEEKTANKQQ